MYIITSADKRISFYERNKFKLGTTVQKFSFRTSYITFDKVEKQLIPNMDIGKRHRRVLNQNVIIAARKRFPFSNKQHYFVSSRNLERQKESR